MHLVKPRAQGNRCTGEPLKLLNYSSSWVKTKSQREASTNHGLTNKHLEALNVAEISFSIIS